MAFISTRNEDDYLSFHPAQASPGAVADNARTKTREKKKTTHSPSPMFLIEQLSEPSAERPGKQETGRGESQAANLYLGGIRVQNSAQQCRQITRQKSRGASRCRTPAPVLEPTFYSGENQAQGGLNDEAKGGLFVDLSVHDAAMQNVLLPGLVQPNPILQAPGQPGGPSQKNDASSRSHKSRRSTAL